MVWLWLLFPVVLLGATLALWRVGAHLREQHRALRDEVDGLAPLRASTRSPGPPTGPPTATGREPGHR